MMRHLCWALLLGAALLAAAPAQARPRDEALSGAFRCAVIADSRVWLDCYYGAAQPVRAELGLPPAPDTQQSLVPPPDQPAPPARKSFFDRLWPF